MRAKASQHLLGNGLISLFAALLAPCTVAGQIGLQQDFIIPTDNLLHEIPGLSETRTLAAGQSIYINAKGQAASSTAGILMLALKVECSLPASNPSGSLWTSRNHEGNDFHQASNGELALIVRYLFKAPTTGTYTCKFLARSARGTGATASDKLTLRAANTSLNTVNALEGSDAWGSSADKDSNFVPGTSITNIHFGPGLPAGTSGYVLRSNRWRGAANAASVVAMGDIEVTSCYAKTGSCDAYAQGPGPDRYGTLLDSRLVLLQMPDATASLPCATHYGDYVRTAIRADAHHQKIYHTLAAVPFSPACGTSRHFISTVEVSWISGDPIKLEAPNYSTNILLNK
ncbi:MAG: hypothetical protein ABWY06_22065 [Pseudomonas sp.]|uniref:hypothetical protein n=1 Tax=Pseudomonas sp. TaxID=306 RepID=UPI00339A9D56